MGGGMSYSITRSFQKDSLGLEPGVINPRPCQRLLAFHNHILRGHQPVCPAYIPFSAPPIPPNLDHTRAVHTIHLSPGKGCARATALVGPNCSHLVQRDFPVRCYLVTVQQGYRNG